MQNEEAQPDYCVIPIGGKKSLIIAIQWVCLRSDQTCICSGCILYLLIFSLDRMYSIPNPEKTTFSKSSNKVLA